MVEDTVYERKGYGPSLDTYNYYLFNDRGMAYVTRVLNTVDDDFLLSGRDDMQMSFLRLFSKPFDFLCVENVLSFIRQRRPKKDIMARVKIKVRGGKI